MQLFQKIKHFFRYHFREFFVYHHSSLEFRAKLFAVVAGADEKFSKQEYTIIKEQAKKIYDDPNRIETLLSTIEEYIHIIQEKNTLGVDELAKDIEKLVRRNRRFVAKIDTALLMPLVEVQTDQDTKDYQRHIIEFLEQVKQNYTISDAS